MKHYEINITNEALLDMNQIYNYIAYTLKSPINASKQYKHIAEQILKLEIFPNKFVKFEYESNKFLHRMVVDNYSIFYHIGDNVVTTTNVLYNGSDIQTKLKNL